MIVIDKTFSYGRLIECRIEECDNKQWAYFCSKIDLLDCWSTDLNFLRRNSKMHLNCRPANVLDI